jgi:hypothetical protein
MNSSENSIGKELGKLFNEIHEILCGECEYKKFALKAAEVQKPAHNSVMMPCPYHASFGTQCPLTVLWVCLESPCYIDRAQHQ